MNFLLPRLHDQLYYVCYVSSRGLSTSTSLEKKEGAGEKSTEKRHRKDGEQPKK